MLSGQLNAPLQHAADETLPFTLSHLSVVNKAMDAREMQMANDDLESGAPVSFVPGTLLVVLLGETVHAC